MGRQFPKAARRWGDLQSELAGLHETDADWRDGRVPLYVFHAGDDVAQVAKDAYLDYFSENGLGGAAFPGLQKLECAIVDASLALLNAPQNATGTLTSGGTESIFLAVKTARDHAAAKRSGVTGAPEIVLPRTAHPAFDKAAHYQGLKTVRVEPAGPAYRADVGAMEQAITERTILIVSSAPAFPHGAIDPIADLGRLAERRGIPLHVDACVGGFLVPFARMNGEPIGEFDFAVPGVASMSADIHKYGYAAKGASLVLYRDADYAAHQAFVFDDWHRGLYRTKTFTGTRAGGAIAAAWAVMNYLGEDGYRRAAREVVDVRRKLQSAIEETDGLHLIGKPELGIIAYGADDFDINAVGDQLAKKGWYVGRLSEPKGLHLMLNPVHAGSMDRYISDLREAVDIVRREDVHSVTAATY